MTDNNFSPAGQNIKFFLDKVSSAVALLLLSPLFVYIAWRVKRDSPGPVFFRQERIGYLGQPFWMYKFRTMYVNAEENGPSLSSEDDPRVTPFGRVMRKYRLDELPQFWNVLKGDMSLVGPRPERKYFIRRNCENGSLLLSVAQCPSGHYLVGDGEVRLCGKRGQNGGAYGI